MFARWSNCAVFARPAPNRDRARLEPQVIDSTQLRPPSEPTRLGRQWALLGVIVMFLAALAFMAWRTLQVDDAQQAALKAKTAAQLPATPEDIEKHGEQARSMLAPDDARARNESVPFASGTPVAARPFVFRGADTDRARALECLSAAVLYEAGDDARGQAAVAQVVLNRVRHAAFPATICGVVYQGSQRRTGCQFTFTCDGSLRRVMPDAAWARARAVARAALDGSVDSSVGLATHYHTDWVYPYWSPSLKKLARVGTHLFFGWPGGWGGPGAFSRTYRGKENVPGSASLDIAAMDEAGEFAIDDPEGPKILGLPQPKAELPATMGNVPLYGNRLRLVGSDGHSFGLLAPPGTSASKLVNAALALCGQPGPCRVNAWSNEDDIPGEFPLPEGAKATMVFEYVRGGSGGGASPRFDCETFPSKDPSRCLAPRANLDDVLPGVRWKSN